MIYNYEKRVLLMTIKELSIEIEKKYNFYFPKSKCFVKFSKNLYSSIYITCFLAGDKTENICNYWDNDLFKIRFEIDNDNKPFKKEFTIDSLLPDNLLLTNHSKYYLIKPIYNKYNAYDSKSLKFRKSKGNCNKILNSLEKFFIELKKELISDLENDIISKINHKKLLKNKLEVL